MRYLIFSCSFLVFSFLSSAQHQTLLLEWTVTVEDTITFPNYLDSTLHANTLTLIQNKVNNILPNTSLIDYQNGYITYNPSETALDNIGMYDAYLRIHTNISSSDDKYLWVTTISIRPKKGRKIYRRTATTYLSINENETELYGENLLNLQQFEKIYTESINRALSPKSRKYASLEIERPLFEVYDDFLIQSKVFNFKQKSKNNRHKFELDENNEFQIKTFHLNHQGSNIDEYNYDEVLPNEIEHRFKFKNDWDFSEYHIQATYSKTDGNLTYFINTNDTNEKVGSFHYGTATNKDWIIILYGEINGVSYQVEYNRYSNFIIVWNNDTLSSVVKYNNAYTTGLSIGLNYTVYLNPDLSEQQTLQSIKTLILFLCSENI